MMLSQKAQQHYVSHLHDLFILNLNLNYTIKRKDGGNVPLLSMKQHNLSFSYNYKNTSILTC